MKKLRIVLAALAISLVAGSVAPAFADVKAPGVCKKQQGGSDCNGNSECSDNSPHYQLLPNGQQKKC